MHIEMEITLRCNAKCPSCSRHCHYGFYDESSDVTMDQVARFAQEVIKHGDIDLVSIMGGEPLLHPHLTEIILLVKALKNHGNIKRCQIVTNGKIEAPQGLMTVNVIPEDSPLRPQNHRCQFVAPFDTGQELKDCPVPHDCGVSWGAFGWYPCGAGGAICRLFGHSQYRRDTIPDTADDFPQRNTMCMLCQAKAKTYMLCRDFGDIRSVSFRKAISEFDSERLERY